MVMAMKIAWSIAMQLIFISLLFNSKCLYQAIVWLGI